MRKSDIKKHFVGSRTILSENEPPAVNTRRRSILKWIALGSGTFILGKILGPSFTLFGDSTTLGKTHIFKNFRVVEKGSELGFYDGLGNEILVLEKDPHAGE